MKITGFTFCFALLLLTALPAADAGIPAVDSGAEEKRSLEEIFPAEICRQLRENGRVQRSLFKQEGELDYAYLPDGPLSAEIADLWTDEKCSYMNETVYLYRKPAGRENRDIERILKSVSALEGITYFSNSRQEDRLLYKRSYRISDAENKTPLPDPVTEDLDGLSFLVLQEDLTFGENIYRFSYRKDGGCIALFFQNETPLKVMIFTAIRAQEMKSVLLVEDLGDEILFYGLVRADYLSVPGMQKRIDASLSSRMDAMYQWFIAMYEK